MKISVTFLLAWTFPMEVRVFNKLETLKNVVPGIIIGETCPVNFRDSKNIK